MKRMKKLSEIQVGKEVVIKEFENNEIFIKLMEMGCIPGEKIKVEQIAPLGDPISITVVGYSLSLRLNEAQYIFVEEIVWFAVDKSNQINFINRRSNK